MSNQKELYGVTVETAYFVGVGNAGFRLEYEKFEKLILQNVIVEILADPHMGINYDGIHVWTELHSRELLCDTKDKRISSMTFERENIDYLVAFLLENEPAP